MSSSAGYEAVKLLAKAQFEHGKGRLERALKLLNEVISLGEADERLKGEHAYLLAHIELHKIHQELGHEREATQYYKKAKKLGATDAELRD